jgi:16S rRNA (adenine1518-N6/adenine1519-N6)-dimethyltransferase
VHRIIEYCRINNTDNIIEIGPGLGALTRHLVKKGKSLTFIEYDTDIIPILQQNVGNVEKLQIINKDVLKVQFDKLFTGYPIKLIGNLPYNISSALLFYLVDFTYMFGDMYFMLQKEVVDRITAKPNNKIYGRLSVMLQYHFHAEGLFAVPPSAFQPMPKVNSKFIHITPLNLAGCKANNYELFSKVVKDTFAQRRKTLRNTLKSFMTDSNILSYSPVDLMLRPENISVKDFVLLSNFLENKLCQPM